MLAHLHVPRTPAALAPLALAGALAGCGGSASSDIASKPAAAILTAARSAAESASSVHVVSNASQDKGKLSAKSNLELASNGGRAQLSFLGISSETIRIANTLYVKGSRSFYTRLSRRGLHVPRGAWLKTTANSPSLGQLAALTDATSELHLLIKNTGTLTKGTTTTINGQKAIELKEATKHFTSTIYIATTGSPYPIEIIKHGRETSQTTFSGWNQPTPLAAPANAVELANLEHEGR